tara:strand:+ start:6287 stop:6991 length:705 start_codon:yes stop_codon:yes gene_type:complete
MKTIVKILAWIVSTLTKGKFELKPKTVDPRIQADKIRRDEAAAKNDEFYDKIMGKISKPNREANQEEMLNREAEHIKKIITILETNIDTEDDEDVKNGLIENAKKINAYKDIRLSLLGETQHPEELKKLLDSDKLLDSFELGKTWREQQQQEIKELELQLDSKKKGIRLHEPTLSDNELPKEIREALMNGKTITPEMEDMIIDINDTKQTKRTRGKRDLMDILKGAKPLMEKLK